MTISLSYLKSQVRSRTNMENSTFITENELTTYINQANEELYDYLIAAWEDYSVTSSILTNDGTVNTLDVPVNCYKLRGLDRQISGESWARIDRYNFKDRNQFVSPFGIITNQLWNNVQYNWVGTDIQLIPQTQSAGTYRIWFIPTLVLLVDDNDNIRSDLEKFADFIITSASIKCLAKEESDVSIFMAQLDLLKDRVKKMMPNKDDASPSHLNSWEDGELNFGRFNGSRGW